jgi:chaperonin GroES
MKSLKPMNDNVLIRKKEEEKKTAGGLFIPETAQLDNMYAEVMAVGPGRVLENGSVVPMTVKPGNVILVPPHGGVQIKFEGEDFVMIQEYQVLAVCEQ